MGNIRRSRGYNFEHYLEELYNQTGHCRRLGGSSVGLPDLLYININEVQYMVFAIEAKSTGQANLLYIPKDQIDRCFTFLKMFTELCDERCVMFCFKFAGSSKVRRPIKQYHFFTGHENEERFKDIKHVRCDYNGVLLDDKGVKIEMHEHTPKLRKEKKKKKIV